jgi:hypothetical protein
MTHVLLWGYIGPETMLPLASFVAGLVGALLVGWRYVLATVSRIIGRLFGRHKNSDPLTTPPSPEMQD